MTPPTAQPWRARIVCDPAIHHGEPTIKGTRIAVSTLVASLVDYSVDDILKQFPQLTRDDIHAAILYAAESAQHAGRVNDPCVPIRCDQRPSSASRRNVWR